MSSYHDSPPDRLLPEPGEGPYKGPEPGDIIQMGDHLGVIKYLKDEGPDRPLLAGVKFEWDGDFVQHDMPATGIHDNFGQLAVDPRESTLLEVMKFKTTDQEVETTVRRLQELLDTEIKGWLY